MQMQTNKRYISRDFFYFLLSPLFKGGRWILWFVMIFPILMMNDAITAMTMTLPSSKEVDKVSGNFVHLLRNHVGKKSSQSIAIQDAQGVLHYCNCTPSNNSDCFSSRMVTKQSVLEEHPLKSNLEYFNHIQILKKLHGQPGEVWMYANSSPFSFGVKSCYQIAYKGFFYLTFEDSVSAYSKVKNSFSLLIFKLLIALIFLVFLMYFYIRFNSFKTAKLKLYGPRSPNQD